MYLLYSSPRRAAVDDDAQHVVIAQRLHGAGDRIDGGVADADHQQSPVAQGRKQVRVGGEEQRRAIQNDPVEQAAAAGRAAS